jgi:myxalamid-type polyketide synthase MxaE and MxaD
LLKGVSLVDPLAERLASLSPDQRAALAELLSAAPAPPGGAPSAPVGTSEPLAIVGMACRFPGADSPESFWRLLEAGVDAVRPVPADRWDMDEYYDPTPGKPGKIYAREGGFLDQIDLFDAHFFGITPREAVRMDPQQRILLETSWEAFENAGLSLDRLAGSDTGVFVGLTTNDYAYLQIPDIASFNGHAGMGGGHCIATGRIAYLYDFHGPNVALDTACSSSLVAVHLACQSLRNRECSTALAGGINVMAAPHCTVFLSEWGALAPDGRCKTFSKGANGFGRGEGCGFVVLKRLADAIADRDRVLAVIRGTAMNQDGRTTRLSAPNMHSQVAVVRKALADAHALPSQITYVEAHGTGTPVGDPIEVEALTVSVGQPRADGSRCALGSVKANIAHSEAAAGVAGLIKTVLAMQHDTIPAQLHLAGINPAIRLDGTPFFIPDRNVPWPRTGEPRLAGISSFGLSGTNAHVVVADPPAESPSPPAPPQSAYVLPLSARSSEALKALAARYREFLASDAGRDASAADICYSAAVRRSHLPYRLAVVGATKNDLAQRLAALSEKDLAPPSVHPASPERLTFVFSGQGSQWTGMSRGLLASEPVFRQKIAEIDAIFRPLAGWSIVSELLADPAQSRLADTEVAQPAIFAVQMGLVALYRSWGIVPDAVVGHSAGEVAAACVAGSLSLADAVKVVYHRARLMQRTTGQGRMAAVGLCAADAERAIAGFENRLAVASINGPTSTVISGDADVLAGVLDRLKQQNVFCKDLGVNYAFHTHQMEPILAELRTSLADLAPRAAELLFVSTTTGHIVAGPALAADHWVRNIRQPVRFAEAIDRLIADECRVFLEIGPQPVLSTPLAQCLKAHAAEGAVLASLREGQDERACLLRAVAGLYAAGCKLDWDAIAPAGRWVQLPNYPWQRKRCWLANTPSFAKLRLEGTPAAPATAAASAAPSIAAAPAAEPAGRDVIASFYDKVSVTAGADEAFQHLTFAPFLEVVPGFSWMMTFYQHEVRPEFAELTRQAHRQLRKVLFRGIDFAQVRNVLDFGCGYGTDLSNMAAAHPHLVCDGYTLSPKQAELGNRRAKERGLAGRVSLYCRDSAQDEFPRQYDLVIGFEVAHYIADKHKLFAHIERHLADGGFIVLADFVANTVSEIRDDHTNSYFSTLDQWCEVLSEYRLRVVECVDVSQEMANFLHDPDAEKNLALIVSRVGNEGAVRTHLASYDGLGKLFRKKLATYGLFTIQKDRFLSKAEIARINREKIGRPTPYADVVRREGLVDDATPRTQPSLGPAADWLYDLDWEPTPLPQNGALAAGGTWLILADERGVGQLAAQELRAHGQTCILVQAGPKYAALAADRFVINPARPEDFRELLADALTPDLPPCSGVIHLWGLDARPAARTTLHSLQSDQTRTAGSLLHTIQALAAVDWPVPPRLWIATQGVHAPAGAALPATTPGAVAQGTLWGMGRTIAAEQPRFWGGLVDLDAAADAATNARDLAAELLGHHSDDQIAYAGATRCVGRLRKRSDLAAGAAACVAADATYLITGGLGGLGLEVARWLAQNGARHIALVQRSELPAREAWSSVDPASPAAARIAAVQSIEAAGASVHLFAADVAREEDVARVLARIHDTLPPLKGVFHAAGLLDDGILPQLDLARLQRVLAAKVSGAWNLHRHTLSDELDCFVLFSSAAALMGSPGQANYSAANAGLDALAHQRRREGLPALSVNWGPWADVGMAAAQANRGQRVAQHGVASIPPDAGVAILARLLASDAPQVAAIALDVARLVESWPAAAKMPLLARLLGRSHAAPPAPARTSAARPAAPAPTAAPPKPALSPAAPAASAAPPTAGSIRERLLAAAGAERRKLLDDYLRVQTARVLQLSAADLDFRQPLNRMGIDSLMAVELRNILESELGVGVPLVTLLEGSSLADLSKSLLAELPAAAPDAARVAEAMAQLDSLSDEAVAELLAQKRLIGS